jgi:hypothetical protein
MRDLRDSQNLMEKQENKSSIPIIIRRERYPELPPLILAFLAFAAGTASYVLPLRSPHTNLKFRISAIDPSLSREIEAFTATRGYKYSDLEGVTPHSPRHVTSCGILDKANATYTLGEDLTAPGTCISVQADGITLDLNGHTITYATAPALGPRHGILAEACWDTTLSGNPCGGSADHLTVLNGTITQGSGAAPYSHAIQIGQINRTNHLIVYDVIFNISATSSIPVYSTFAGSDSSIYRNTFHNDVKSVVNRYQIQGASIMFQNAHNLSPGQVIRDNKIIGGAQGGIFSASPATQFYNNTISQNGRYSNDFAVYVWGNKDEAFNNIIQPISGRGIQIAGGAVSTGGPGAGSHGAIAHDNKISVIELQQNCDYSQGGAACNVCEPGGAYGIQFDDRPSNGVVYKNTVRARAEQCDAQALRLTNLGSDNTSHDNLFVAERVGQGRGKAWALGTGGAPSHFVATNDTFTADSANFHADWDGMPGGLTCIRCTLEKGPNAASDYVTFSFENGGHPVSDVHFQDSTFAGGAAKDSTDMRAIGSNRQYAEYFIDWTYTLDVKTASGNAVSGATVTITDATHKQVFSGQTNASGEISVVLNEFKVFNTREGVTREPHTPDEVTVRAPGCTPNPDSFTVTLSQTTTQKIQLTCEASGKQR